MQDTASAVVGTIGSRGDEDTEIKADGGVVVVVGEAASEVVAMVGRAMVDIGVAETVTLFSMLVAGILQETSTDC